MPDTGPAAAAHKPRVFISYSRADLAFADELVVGLEMHGLEALIDRKVIAPGEDWQARLGRLIHTADAVVFVLSPDSVASGICAWGLEESERQSKRILPVRSRPVEPSAQIPAAAQQGTVIAMDGGHLISGLKELVTALGADLAQLHEPARRAEEAARENDEPLAGKDTLDEAGFAETPRSAPDPDVTRHDVPASADAETSGTSEERRHVEPFQLAAQQTRVFISYARAEMAFADRLAGALESSGYDVLIDRQSLPTLEDWQRELLVLIRKADTVVFIVSPRSIASATCKWEVEQMAALDKRMAPVVLERVADDKIPAAIARINYLFFDPPSDFDAQAEALARALQTDIGWWHEHTRIVDLAGRWDREGRHEGQLLRSAAITAAQAWASRRPDGAHIPETVFQFLDASLKKEEHDREELDKREQRISQQTQHLVAEQARQAREEGRFASALRLALAGEPSEDGRTRGIASEPTRRAHLAGAAHAALCVASLSGHSVAAFSPDGGLVVTNALGNTARIWDAVSGAEVAQLLHNGPVQSAAFSADGMRVATAAHDEAARVWESGSGPGASWRELARLPHDWWPKSAAFSADGARVLTFASEAAYVWDAASGAEIARLVHDRPVQSAVFSPDAARVVTASGDTARLWDVASGVELVRLPHEHLVNSAAFRLDGTRVVTASEDRTARVWQPGSEFWPAAAWREVARLAHDGRVNDAAFSADGARVVTAAHDKTARVWDATLGIELARFAHDSEVRTAAFSPDGARVATTTDDRTARIWDAASGTEIARLVHDGWVRSAEFSPDGARIATASHDNTARLWDTAGRVELSRLGHGDCVWSAAFSPNGAQVVTASGDKTARVWDAASGAELGRLVHDELVRSTALSPNGAQVLTASGNLARLWDVASGEEIARLAHDDWVVSAAFSRNGARVATASGDGTARLWEPGSESGPGVIWREVARLTHDDLVGSATFSPDGMRVVTAGRDRTARVWEPGAGATWREVARLAHDDWVRSAAFSPDGAWVVTASDDRTARVWDAASGVELARLAHDGGVNSAAFSLDGARVATASADSTARLWEPGSLLSQGRSGPGATWREIARLAHHAQVNNAVFSPDGTRVITAAHDNTARVWDMASGAELARFVHDGPVWNAVLSPDGAQVVTASEDKTARLWDVTWAVRLTGDALVRAAARTRLVGEGRLTEQELRILRALLGEVDPDVVSRWLAPSPDDAEIEAALAQWRRHREMALALARKDWAARAAEIKAALALPHSARTKDASAETRASVIPPPQLRSGSAIRDLADVVPEARYAASSTSLTPAPHSRSGSTGAFLSRDEGTRRSARATFHSRRRAWPRWVAVGLLLLAAVGGGLAVADLGIMQQLRHAIAK